MYVTEDGSHIVIRKIVAIYTLGGRHYVMLEGSHTLGISNNDREVIIALLRQTNQ